MKRIKTITSILLVCAMLVSCLVFTSSAKEWVNPFTDLDPGAWYMPYVEWGCINGYFTGTSKTEFSPDKPMTRAELVTILFKFYGADLNDYQDRTSFDDVAVDSWFAPYIEWAYENGIVSGVGNDLFAPNIAVKRQEICLILLNYVKYLDELSTDIITLPIVNPTIKFSDYRKISDWAEDSVSMAQRTGLVAGMQDGSFSPLGSASRAQTAAMLKSLSNSIDSLFAPCDPKVIAYYNCRELGWTALNEVENIDVLNYLGGNAQANKTVVIPFTDRIESGISWVKAKNPDIKVLLSVIGWGDFEKCIYNYAACEEFADNLAGYCSQYGFDGIDFDWEFPNGSRWQQLNFTYMLKELRESLDALGKETGKDYYISFTTPGGNWAFKLYDLAEAQLYTDFINIMSYDTYAERGMTSHHTAPFGNPASGYTDASIDEIIQIYIRNGIQKSKIIPGAGMYARCWSQVQSETDGLFAPGRPVNSYLHYTVLLGGYINKNGYVRYWDDIAKAPYLYNKTDHIFYTYDDHESVQIKCDLIKQYNIGGIMIFEYSTTDGIGFFKDVYDWLK